MVVKNKVKEENKDCFQLTPMNSQDSTCWSGEGVPQNGE